MDACPVLWAVEMSSVFRYAADDQVLILSQLGQVVS